MDAALTHWINGFSGQVPALDMAMIALTRYGVPLAVLLVAAMWFSRTDRPHVRHVAICAGLAFVLGLALNQGLLMFVHRVRPYDAGVSTLLIDRSADWSFPSDHATAVFAIYAAFAFQRLRWQSAMFAVLAVLVCLSRVYVGTHYVTDVLGGAATGILAAVFVRAVYREGNRIDRFLTSIL